MRVHASKFIIKALAKAKGARAAARASKKAAKARTRAPIAIQRARKNQAQVKAARFSRNVQAVLSAAANRLSKSLGIADLVAATHATLMGLMPENRLVALGSGPGGMESMQLGAVLMSANGRSNSKPPPDEEDHGFRVDLLSERKTVMMAEPPDAERLREEYKKRTQQEPPTPPVIPIPPAQPASVKTPSQAVPAHGLSASIAQIGTRVANFARNQAGKASNGIHRIGSAFGRMSLRAKPKPAPAVSPQNSLPLPPPSQPPARPASLKALAVPSGNVVAPPTSSVSAVQRKIALNTWQEHFRANIFDDGIQALEMTVLNHLLDIRINRDSATLTPIPLRFKIQKDKTLLQDKLIEHAGELEEIFLSILRMPQEERVKAFDRDLVLFVLYLYVDDETQARLQQNYNPPFDAYYDQYIAPKGTRQMAVRELPSEKVKTAPTNIFDEKTPVDTNGSAAAMLALMGDLISALTAFTNAYMRETLRVIKTENKDSGLSQARKELIQELRQFAVNATDEAVWNKLKPKSNEYWVSDEEIILAFQDKAKGNNPMLATLLLDTMAQASQELNRAEELFMRSKEEEDSEPSDPIVLQPNIEREIIRYNVRDYLSWLVTSGG